MGEQAKRKKPRKVVHVCKRAVFGLEGGILAYHSGLQVQENAAGNVLAGTRFRKERVEGIVFDPNRLIRGHRAIRLNAMFQAIELPAGITGLNASLTDVDRNNFTHFEDAKSCFLIMRWTGKRQKKKGRLMTTGILKMATMSGLAASTATAALQGTDQGCL